MLIAFISDVHANLPALQAAVADAKKRGATRIICAGDITGYGPFPDGVCDFLHDGKIESISGNYDIKVLDVIKNGKSAVAGLQKKKKAVVVWTAKNLKKTSRQYLKDLPESIEEELPGGHKLLVVHGSTISNDDDIYPSITANGLKTKLKSARPDILVCGHTHIPFIKRVGAMLVINCGSAGHPVDGDPRPAYAILSIEGAKTSASIVRFAYNVKKVVVALKKTSLPKGLQKDYVEGTKRRFLE
ncbi:MAG TPA: metallophosphoesterase family protein [Dehalococcoidales bacterium]|nr:metallophosphoesterase family protein [Dehalococcoidales bacterium]